jgi:integrase
MISEEQEVSLTTRKTKGAKGGGTIRQRPDGRWEARYTLGIDPGTGKQIQKSVYGKTQKEVAQNLRQITAEIDAKTYVAPCKLSVAEWMAVWAQDYLVGIKASTAYLYKRTIELYIEPHLGHIRLDTLNAHTVQHFYNELAKPSKPDAAPLSAKSIKNIHGVLHKALQQAVLLNYIRYNPTTACVLPKIVKKEIHPLTDQQTAQLLNLLKGSKYEIPLTVDLFTGLREGELLGLIWDCVDFEKGTILVNKQLRRSQRKGGTYYFSPPKNNKSRTITPAPYVMKLLQAQKVQQARQRLMAGPAWEDSGLVFTNEFGRYISYRAIFDSFKRIVKRIGLSDARIHDLRHTYAVNCIRAGDDIKTVQSNLGHATAAFTLDVYGHFTDDMRSVSAQRMEGFIANVLNL